MKKLLLSMLCLASFDVIDAARQDRIYLGVPVNPQLVLANYTPATGPLQLGDTVANGQITYGFMIDRLSRNPDFAVQLSDVQNFMTAHQMPDESSYQEIMALLRSPQHKEAAIKAICAFEKVIMHLYDERAYKIGHYRPVQSIFITGIRKNLFDAQINAELNQLLDELYNLAKVASVHSAITHNRLWATAHSYKHWRRTMMISCIAYLGFDAAVQDGNKSTVYKLYKGGLSGIPGVVANIGSNIKQGTKMTLNTVIGTLKTSWNYGVVPTTKALFLGADGFTSKESTSASNGVTNMKATIQKNIPKTAHAAATYVHDAWYSFVDTCSKPKLIAPTPKPSLWQRFQAYRNQPLNSLV